VILQGLLTRECWHREHGQVALYPASRRGKGVQAVMSRPGLDALPGILYDAPLLRKGFECS
jgi:hypothetical protein